MGRHRFLDHPRPLAFAHRGGAGVHPENTLRAFAHAVELGYTHLETDVHVTADGVALAFHDEVLDRVTDRTGRVAELTWAEVRRARIGGSEPVLRLDELLEAFPDTFVNLDPKHDAAVEPLVDLVARTGALERICIGSFSDRRIAELRRRLGPGLCTSAGPRGVARLQARSRGMPVPVPDVACVQVPVRAAGTTIVTPRFVETAHHYGIDVHVWTIDDPAEMRRLLDLGVDGIMTDEPETLLRVVSEYRQGHPHTHER
ncbi:MAG: glycerophosphodiester phosphodiesterase [Actinomyces sp.]|nr:MAG: glycerophosphodiester phosphodiesterase [Actinomyces sp.]